MKYRLTVVLTVCLFLACLTGCDRINEFLGNKKPVVKKTESEPALKVKGTIIAMVNTIPITLEELNQEIELYNESMDSNGNSAGKITSRGDKINYLKKDMVRQALLYQEALDRGLDKKEEILKILDRTKRDLLVMDLVREVTDKVDVTSKEVEDYYNSSKKIGRTLFYEIVTPEERQVREIAVPTESEARDILIQLLQGSDFTTLAKERSKASSAKNGGDLGFISPGKQFKEFDTTASVLDVGKVSNIFKGPEGYYIIKVESKRGGIEKTLSEMWDDIKKEVTYIKKQQTIETLLNKLAENSKQDFFEGEIR